MYALASFVYDSIYLRTCKNYVHLASKANTKRPVPGYANPQSLCIPMETYVFSDSHGGHCSSVSQRL